MLNTEYKPHELRRHIPIVIYTKALPYRVMISPYQARRYIASRRVPYGQNVALPGIVDTSECQEFFGTRCPHNVHVKGRRLAHVDRVDPRRDPIGHLKKDVGIPYAVMGGLAGAALGSVPGLVAGSIVGLTADIVSHLNAAGSQQQTRQPYPRYYGTSRHMIRS